MRIELSEEQKLLQETVQRFAEEVVRPRAQEIDESGEFPRDFYDQAGELGLAGVAIAQQDGGAGMDEIAYCVVIEEISAACATSGRSWPSTRWPCRCRSVPSPSSGASSTW